MKVKSSLCLTNTHHIGTSSTQTLTPRKSMLRPLDPTTLFSTLTTPSPKRKSTRLKPTMGGNLQWRRSAGKSFRRLCWLLTVRRFNYVKKKGVKVVTLEELVESIIEKEHLGKLKGGIT